MLDSKIRPLWDRVMRPVGRGLVRTKVSPDAITFAGVALQGWAAYQIVEGGLVAAGLISIGAALADVLDGAVAKARGITSNFGAVLDSVTDRISDALLFLPVAWLYGVAPDKPEHDEPWLAAAAMVALVGSFLVPYVRSKAESFGYDCKVGIAERAERVLLVIAGLLFDILLYVVPLIAVLSVITFVQRMLHVRRQAKGDTG
ncbi:MAG TPA: CDP-alcohol phosphatidyltransferase family protein [Actinomycetota bacterium]|nr:CDP-alcohol phosphatidyltransferase family protein [Actinomycetota bacterium]